jgi:hypothetical protein
MKRPPYSQLMHHRSHDHRNRQQSFWILVGTDAWDKAKRWQAEPHRVFAICPPNENPATFDWSAYRQAPPPVGLVRCGDVDGDQLTRLVQVMLAAGSPRIYDISADTVYQRRELAA